MRPVLLVTFFITFLCLHADPPPPPGAHGTTTHQPPVGAPIDDGFWMLLVAGSAYGLFKMYRRKKPDTDLRIVKTK